MKIVPSVPQYRVHLLTPQAIAEDHACQQLLAQVQAKFSMEKEQAAYQAALKKFERMFFARFAAFPCFPMAKSNTSNTVASPDRRSPPCSMCRQHCATTSCPRTPPRPSKSSPPKNTNPYGSKEIRNPCAGTCVTRVSRIHVTHIGVVLHRQGSHPRQVRNSGSAGGDLGAPRSGTLPAASPHHFTTRTRMKRCGGFAAEISTVSATVTSSPMLPGSCSMISHF